MRSVETVAAVREAIREARDRGARVVLVPTMGDLHAGHLSLMARARGLGEHVVASVFVNPLQFGPGEDYERYPRDLGGDRRKLEEAGVDLLFAPPVEALYPRGQGQATQVRVPGLGDILCGAHRPGHFVGVTTVVSMLLNIITPETLVLGRKDYQQCLVVRRMIEDLHLPVALHIAPTVREPDGLAMSSRNQYLTPRERAVAPALYRTLRGVHDRVLAGEVAYAEIEGEGKRALFQAGLDPEYLSIRAARDLGAPEAGEELVVLAAARLGRARLIDNVAVGLPERP